MLGRGVDQILPYSNDPEIHEPFVKSASTYVELAEEVSGAIPRGVSFDYVWGDALEVLDRAAPDARIINLETAVTTSDDWLPKGINYRMHPANVPCLTAARIDCCSLANNHVLDYGRAGLEETLATLARAGIAVAGAGRTLEAARAPAVLATPKGGRVLVFGVASMSSGVPPDWTARSETARVARGATSGVHLLEAGHGDPVERIRLENARHKRPGDVAVLSLHAGENWGYAVPGWQRALAHAWIDHAGIDVVHGHSSHHPKAIEVHAGKLILYGAGDFLNDYEGITGYEEYRSELTLMYLVTLSATDGTLEALEMVPFRIRRFRLERASLSDSAWLADTLDRESRRFGARVVLDGDRLRLKW